MNKFKFDFFFWFVEGVKVKIYFKAQPHKIQGDTYLSLEQMKLDFSVKNIKMGVENVHDGNTVLRKY